MRARQGPGRTTSRARPARLTIDEVLTPSRMGCATCGDGRQIDVYPTADGIGIGVCPVCTPAWVGAFARFQLDEWREREGLARLYTPDQYGFRNSTGASRFYGGQ